MVSAINPIDVSALPYAYGKPSLSGTIRTQVEDFIVEEKLGFAPASEGEHVFLLIEKRSTNTQWLAEQLAKFAKVRSFDVGYAGLKDRHAITRQWFSIYMPKESGIDWERFTLENVTILRQTRHTKKLRRGILKGNYFEILLRDLRGDLSTLAPKLEKISQRGVPNYFGNQRFGHEGNNIEQAEKLFRQGRKVPRQKRSMYLSAIRAWLFNLVLARRITEGNWHRVIAGDVMMLAGCRSFFVASEVDNELQERIDTLALSPTGPLHGKGESISLKQTQELEASVLNDHEHWLQGLAQAGLTQERRPLILPVEQLQWDFDDNGGLLLKFFLKSGCYATAVLREMVNF